MLLKSPFGLKKRNICQNNKTIIYGQKMKITCKIKNPQYFKDKMPKIETSTKRSCTWICTYKVEIY